MSRVNSLGSVLRRDVRVQHLYRREPIQTWVDRVEREQAATLYWIRISATEACEYLLDMAAYAEIASREPNFSMGIANEAGGFSFEIIGEGDAATVLVDSGAGRTPMSIDAAHRRLTTVDGIRIQGEDAVRLFEETWENAYRYVRDDSRTQFAEWAKQLGLRESAARGLARVERLRTRLQLA